MKKYIFTAIAVVASFVAGFEVNREKAELIKAYDAYNRDCETLLDSIASWDDSFMDTTGETDVYMDYCISREKLDSIIYKGK